MASAADNEQRIRNLEEQNAELRRTLNEVLIRTNPRPAPPAPPVEDDGPRVTFPRTSPIQLPTVAEFERLLILVRRAYPKVVPEFEGGNDQREFFLGFTASFERIAQLRRTVGSDGEPIINAKYGANHWADEAYRWLCERGTPAETMNGSFFAAAIAAGDVAFSFANRAVGVSAHLGIGYEGRVASAAAWRRVLDSGQPRTVSAGPPPPPNNEGYGQLSRKIASW